MPSKKVILRGLLAVGMRHYGIGRSLGIGEVFELTRDAACMYDRSAVSTTLGGIKVASLKRDAAELMAKIMDAHLHNGKIFLKVKKKAYFHSRRSGVAQECNVAFYADERVAGVVENIISGSSFQYAIL